MSYIENTFLAYAFERDPEPGVVAAGLARVESHYAELYADPLVAHHCADGAVGMALWHREDERLRWPLWAEEGDLAVAATNAPTGAEGLEGEGAAAASLGRSLLADPEGLVALNPPFVIAVHDAAARRLLIVNDFIATGRLYGLRTPDLSAWSNRLGALPLFAGTPPEASPEGWALLAAAGWFLGATTPFRGIERVPGGSAIELVAGDVGATVAVRRTAAVNRLVAPRELGFEDASAEAADASKGLARSVARLWAVRPRINFSGGRDSRVSAAGAIAAGIEADFRTMDIEPGEADVVRGLIEALPREVPLEVRQPEHGDPPDELTERVAARHRVHDGIANPMSALQAPLRLPERGFPNPLITGHGGELGHSFYYGEEQLRKLERKGEAAIVERLHRSARQKHGAGRAEAYEAYDAEIRRSLDEGRAHGIEGPSLLDWFYLSQRLAFRAGLGSRNDRYSACATPPFVRAAFDLTPAERVEAKLHRAIVSRLVPQWAEAPYFHAGSGPMRPMKRDRIWEKPRHSEQVAEMLERDLLWSDLFDPDRVREMWAEVKAGGGHSSYEAVFMRIAWRVGFEDHLALLAERAAPAAGAARRADL